MLPKASFLTFIILLLFVFEPGSLADLEFAFGSFKALQK